jgi:hypothetical protein
VAHVASHSRDDASKIAPVVVGRERELQAIDGAIAAAGSGDSAANPEMAVELREMAPALTPESPGLEAAVTAE